eukprot:EG_transcript_24927
MGLEFTRQVPRFLQRLGHGVQEPTPADKFRAEDDADAGPDTAGEEFQRDAVARYMQEHGFKGDPEEFLRLVIENDGRAKAEPAGADAAEAQPAKAALPGKAEASDGAAATAAEDEATGRHTFRARKAQKRPAEEEGGEVAAKAKKRAGAARKLLSFNDDEPEEEG